MEINSVCLECINECKQNNHVKVVCCPNYISRIAFKGSISPVVKTSRKLGGIGRLSTKTA